MSTDQPVYFISTLRPGRPDFLTTMTPGEQRVMGEHLAYADRLFEEGRIVLACAANDGALGVIVWKGGAAEEAQRIFENYPAVRAGDRCCRAPPPRIGLLASR